MLVVPGPGVCSVCRREGVCEVCVRGREGVCGGRDKRREGKMRRDELVNMFQSHPFCACV